jgi:hypothetical protein
MSNFFPGLGFRAPGAYLRLMKRTGKSPPRWRVLRLVGAKAREVCELEAKSADAAIERALREFQIEPEGQKRLAAHRVS